MKNTPQIIYGTAWKEDATEELVVKAIQLGFRGIDTANQRRHYNESGVGNALSQVQKIGVKREEIFLQTKYTYANGQDHRIPYDLNANYSTQVRQSFQSSLEHLHTEYIDSYVLHGPSSHQGWTEADKQVWQEMEAIQREGKTMHLGVSNINIDQLKILWKQAKVKPKFVQNRCYAQQGWDKKVREFCKENNIIYQGFSLLTANPFIIPKIKHISERVNKTHAQIILRFSMDIGILPLTGTTSTTHMKQDLELDFDLEKEEVRLLEDIGVF